MFQEDSTISINFDENHLGELVEKLEDSFWNFGNTYKDGLFTKIPSSAIERKQRILELLKNNETVANNEWEKVILDYICSYKEKFGIEYINIGHEKFDMLAVMNKKYICLYGIESLDTINHVELKKKLMKQKEYIENKSLDIIIDKIIIINFKKNLDVQLTKVWDRNVPYYNKF